MTNKTHTPCFVVVQWAAAQGRRRKTGSPERGSRDSDGDGKRKEKGSREGNKKGALATTQSENTTTVQLKEPSKHTLTSHKPHIIKLWAKAGRGSKCQIKS